MLHRLSHEVRVRGLLVKLWFDDYCKNPNSPIQVDNVTTPQFRNGLARLGLQVTAAETELLVRRFAGKAQGFVDYVAFACAVDEGEKIFSKREPQSVFVNTLHSGFRQTRVSEASLVGKGDQPGRAPTVTSQPRLPMARRFPAPRLHQTRVRTAPWPPPSSTSLCASSQNAGRHPPSLRAAAIAHAPSRAGQDAGIGRRVGSDTEAPGQSEAVPAAAAVLLQGL